MDITLLLVHGDPSVMRGVRMRLEVEPNLRIVGETQREGDLARVAQEATADVVVLDADIVGQNVPDLAAVRALASMRPVVVLTLADSEATSRSLIEAGAAAVVRKHAPSALVSAIRSAATGAREGGPMA